jgi:hypothetical protein
MKRKLIGYDAFEKIQSESLTNVQAELEAAAGPLAEVLDLDGLKVESYGLDKVLFETEEGDLVHADYKISNGHVQFDNIEQVVLNEAAENEKAREVVSKMIDALIESDDAAAGDMLKEWFSMPRSRRILSEAKIKRRTLKRKTVNGKVEYVGVEKGLQNTRRVGKKQPRWLVMKRMKAKMMNNKKRPQAEKNRLKALRKRVKLMKEWNLLAENVLGFVDYTQNGPDVDNCKVLRKGDDVVGVKVPTMRLRNEAKILKFDWKTMNTDVVVKRNSGKRLAENSEFVKEIAELKRLNALSDRGFEESVEKTSTKFPNVIYLTEGELAATVKKALESVDASNFDDETCLFIAEALLRTVHENFVDTVAKIVKIAGGKINEEAADRYAEFKNLAEGLYARLDEESALEMQAFVDVYEALRQVHETAKEEQNESVAESSASHLDGLLPIVSGSAAPDFEVLGEAAEWLYDIVEASDPENWGTQEPVVRADGEHPELAKKGKHSQSPADMEGETPDAQLTSDGKDYRGAAAKELANDGWSNLGGDGVYPSLDNPYVPKAEVPKIVGEKDVDSDSDQLAHWGDNDTWPNLQNPYSKPSVTPKEAK